MLVNQTTRNAIWQELLDVTRLVRYYDALSDKYRNKHFIVRLLLFLAASGEILTLLSLFPDNIEQSIGLLAGFFIAVLVAWDFVCDYAKKAAVLHTISIECSRLETEWKSLWNELGNMSDSEALQKNKDLAIRISEITGWAGQAGINEDPKLNQKCTMDTYNVIREKYNYATG